MAAGARDDELHRCGPLSTSETAPGPEKLPGARSADTRALMFGLVDNREDGTVSPRVATTGRMAERRWTLGIPTDCVAKIGDLMQVVESRLADNRRLLVTFVNPSSRAIGRQHPPYVAQLARFDRVLPDGSGMSLAMRWLHSRPALRISFDSTSLAPEVFGLAERHGYSVALLGGVPGRAQAAGRCFQNAYPQLNLIGTFDGYGLLNDQVQVLTKLDPDILICGMTAGRQEGLLLALADTGWSGCGFTCGGYFDQLEQGLDYYPGWINRLDLRWAYRLAKEPRRLWRRYVYMYPPFVYALACALACRLVGLSGRHRESSADEFRTGVEE